MLLDRERPKLSVWEIKTQKQVDKEEKAKKTPAWKKTLSFWRRLARESRTAIRTILCLTSAPDPDLAAEEITSVLIGIRSVPKSISCVVCPRCWKQVRHHDWRCHFHHPPLGGVCALFGRGLLHQIPLLRCQGSGCSTKCRVLEDFGH